MKLKKTILKHMVQTLTPAPVAVPVAPIATVAPAEAVPVVEDNGDVATVGVVEAAAAEPFPPAGGPEDRINNIFLELAESENGTVELMQAALNDHAEITCRDAKNRTVLDILAATDQYDKLKAMLAIYPRTDAEAKDFISAHGHAISQRAKQLIANCILTQAVKQDLPELAEMALDMGAERDQLDARGYSARGLATHFYSNNNVARFFSGNDNDANNADNNADNSATADTTNQPVTPK